MKKADVREVIQTDTDSEGEASECSFTGRLPGSGFSSQVYNVHDIRHILKVTKSMRRVKIEDFFSDIPQFIEKVKLFRSESQFSDPEVRLKKKFSPN